jgi:DNA-binding transcriptional LysR family regulator
MDAVMEAFHLQGRGGQVVNIGCAFGVTAELIGELTFLFQRENPDYAVMITELRDLECEPAVRRQEVDLAFGIGPVNEQDFSSSLIYSSPYCAGAQGPSPGAGKISQPGRAPLGSDHDHGPLEPDLFPDQRPLPGTRL